MRLIRTLESLFGAPTWLPSDVGRNEGFEYSHIYVKLKQELHDEKTSTPTA